jgi:hypothetical protein
MTDKMRIHLAEDHMDDPTIIVDLGSAFTVLRNAIKSTSENSLLNDKALLTLCEAVIQRMETVDITLSERLVGAEARIQHLELKVEMLHELYHSHFTDDVPDETVN